MYSAQIHPLRPPPIQAADDSESCCYLNSRVSKVALATLLSLVTFAFLPWQLALGGVALTLAISSLCTSNCCEDGDDMPIRLPSRGSLDSPPPRPREIVRDGPFLRGGSYRGSPRIDLMRGREPGRNRPPIPVDLEEVTRPSVRQYVAPPDLGRREKAENAARLNPPAPQRFAPPQEARRHEVVEDRSIASRPLPAATPQRFASPPGLAQRERISEGPRPTSVPLGGQGSDVRPAPMPHRPVQAPPPRPEQHEAIDNEPLMRRVPRPLAPPGQPPGGMQLREAAR